MSANNYLEAIQQEDGTFSIHYGDMDDDGPGRVLAHDIPDNHTAFLFMRAYMANELQGVLEYGPYWHFREEADDAPPAEILTCESCGNQQGDMGRNVACEQCGARMPEE